MSENRSRRGGWFFLTHTVDAAAFIEYITHYSCALKWATYFLDFGAIPYLLTYLLTYLHLSAYATIFFTFHFWICCQLLTIYRESHDLFALSVPNEKCGIAVFTGMWIATSRLHVAAYLMTNFCLIKSKNLTSFTTSCTQNHLKKKTAHIVALAKNHGNMLRAIHCIKCIIRYSVLYIIYFVL